jgi:hypothetical protein
MLNQIATNDSIVLYIHFFFFVEQDYLVPKDIGGWIYVFKRKMNGFNCVLLSIRYCASSEGFINFALKKKW